jgi:hypothetical protein
MFICRVGGANHFFISWGMHELFKQIVCFGLISRGNALQPLGDIIAVALVSNLQQLKMELAMYLLIYGQLI